MIKKTVIPINLTKKHHFQWEQNKTFSAEAFIFENKEDCKEYVAKLICDILQKQCVICFLLQFPYLEKYSLDGYYKHLGTPIRKIKEGALWIATPSKFENAIKEIMKHWGLVGRSQIFFLKNENNLNKNDLADELFLLSKKYKIKFIDYFRIICNCEYILSDTGDGEEFEMIRKIANE